MISSNSVNKLMSIIIIWAEFFSSIYTSFVFKELRVDMHTRNPCEGPDKDGEEFVIRHALVETSVDDWKPDMNGT
jgi:hypothetical protein